MENIPAKTIITKSKAPDYWFGLDYNMNIYKGCSHGCIYCDSRSECYRVKDFGTVKPKENALLIIEKELKAKRMKGVVGTGAMTDPYNPLEKKLQLSRDALQLIKKYGFGVGITTKSDLVIRDIDVLTEIKKENDVIVNMTVTAADDDLSKKIEPHVATSGERFAAIKKLSEAGIFAGILLMPVLPFIEDNKENIGGIIRKAKEAGAKYIYAAFGVTQRAGQREYFHKKLDETFPGMKEKYEKTFGDKYNCESPHAKELYTFFKEECLKHGLLYKMADIIKAYKKGPRKIQESLF